MVTTAKRRNVSGGRRRGARPITAADVPTVNPPSDPGLRISAESFGAGIGEGLQDIGQGLSAMSDSLARAAERQQKQHDATETSNALMAFEDEAEAELRRRQTEDDPARADFMDDYQKWVGVRRDDTGDFELSGKAAAAMARLAPSVSESARQRLRLRIISAGLGSADAAGTLQLQAGLRAAQDSAKSIGNRLAAQAERDPSALSFLLDEGNERLGDFAGTMTPDLERDMKSALSRQVVLAAVQGHADAGEFTEAEDILKVEKYDEFLTRQDRSAARSIIEAGRRRKKEGDRAEHNRVAAMTDDHFASLQATGIGIPEFTERAARAFDDDEFKEFRTQERIALRVYHGIQKIKFGTEAEMKAVVAAAKPIAGSTNYEIERRAHDALAKTATAAVNARNHDAAAYAMQMPAIQAAFEQAGNDPAAYREALSARLAAQEDMGIHVGFQRLLSKDEAAGIERDILTLPAEQQAPRMLQLQEQLGEHYVRAIGEMKNVDGGHQVLSLVAGDPVVAQTVAQVLETGAKELAKGLPSEDIKSVRENVRSELSDWIQAVELGDPTGRRTKSVNEVVATVEAMAIHYYRQTNSVGEAVERATNEVILSRYHIGDTWYAPATINGVPTVPSRIEFAMERELREDAIRAFGPATFGGAVGLTPDAQMDAIVSAARQGYWVTNDTGSSAFLMVPLRGGGAIPLVDENGARYEIDFLDASTTEPTPEPGEVREPPAMPGTREYEQRLRDLRGSEAQDRLDIDLVSAIERKYPKLAGFGFQIIDSRGKEGATGQLEFYSPDERFNPIPGKPTIEIFNPELQGEQLERAVFGDMLHHLPAVDPKFAAMRREFEQTLTDEQKTVDRRAFERAQAEFGESRSFEQWFEISRLDGYLRGFLAPDERDEWRNVYTPEQRKILKRMQQYLRSQ